MDGLIMKYFVLKPKGNDGYAKASRHAMSEYAKWIEYKNPTLAAQLRDWVHRENEIAIVQEQIFDPST